MSSSAPYHTQARGPPPASISTALISSTSDYILKTLHPHDEALSSTMNNSEAQGLPPIAVAETQGKFLYLMAKMKGAKRVLEIGTLVSDASVY
jgi:predicted O-methyltransferase YrrM